MKIAVSSQGKDLSSQVDPRFGRAPYFIIYDTDRESFDVIENTQNLNAVQGAGIQSAQNISRANVDLVISGNIGPKAFAALSATGIKTALWAEGTVAQALELAKNNELEINKNANVNGHWI